METLSLSKIFPKSNRNLESLTSLPNLKSICSSISNTLTLFTGYSKIFFTNLEPRLPAPPVMSIVFPFNSPAIFPLSCFLFFISNSKIFNQINNVTYHCNEKIENFIK